MTKIGIKKELAKVRVFQESVKDRRRGELFRTGNDCTLNRSVKASCTCLPKCFGTQAGIPQIKTQISLKTKYWLLHICEICDKTCE